MFNNDNFLYIDYECNKTHNFYALGYGNNEHTKQIILNKSISDVDNSIINKCITKCLD